MEIDNNNLESHFEKIQNFITNCDFIAIDGEFTGLSKQFVNYFDTQEMRYQAVKENSMQFTITQLGISIFKYNLSEQIFEYYPMNFHVKPHSYESENGNFLVNPETVEFLNKSKFDFNKTFRDGIPYVRIDEYQKNENLLITKKNFQLNKLDISTDIFDFTNIQPIIKQSADFLANNEIEEYAIDVPLSSYEKYLIYNELWKKVGRVNKKWIYPELSTENKKLIILKKCDDARGKFAEVINEKFNKKHQMNSKHVKISEIIKLISDSKKTVIAHNSFLDFMHIVHKFIGSLPEKYEDFKNMLHSLFPKIFDTKYIFHEESFKNFRAENLESIYNVTKQEPFLNPDLITKAFSEEYDFPVGESYHTAHYDAMITGKIFVSLMTYLNKNDKSIWHNFSSEIPEVAHKYLNRLKVVRAEFYSINVNPNSLEKKNGRKQIFHMAIPEKWERNDIVVYLKKFLQKPIQDIYEKVGFNWLNSTSLLIRIPFLTDLKLNQRYQNEDESVTITPFNMYYNVPEPNALKVDSDGFEMVKRRKRS